MADAFYLPVPAAQGGQRYCLYHSPRGTVRGAVVCAHAFAEELNKTRRMAALQSRALADAGYAVLQIDLLGCGDSSGDFGDASWDAWLDDLALAADWLLQRTPAPVWWWGIRAGCLLASEAARRSGGEARLLFWQPPASGKLVLQQFLRLKLAGDMLGGGARVSTDALRASLANDEVLEIAGYPLAPALAHGLEAATLSPPSPPARTGRLECFEVSNRPDAELTPATANTLARWRDAGWTVRSQVVSGPAFWQSVEIETAPQLVAATVAAL